MFRIREATGAAAVSPLAATSGIMLTPVSKPESPSTSSGNAMRAGEQRPAEIAAAAVRAATQSSTIDRIGRDLDQPRDNDHGVQGEEDGDERDRDVDRFGEAQQEHPAEHEEQHDRDRHRLAVQSLGHERVLEQVHGGVRGGEGDGDDP